MCELGIIKIGLIQMMMSADPDANVEKARRNVISAARNGANIICLPELYAARYFPQHPGSDVSGYAETIPGHSTGLFSALAKEHNIVIIVPVFERTPEGMFCNAAVVIDTDGGISKPYRKVHIPQDPG